MTTAVLERPNVRKVELSELNLIRDFEMAVNAADPKDATLFAWTMGHCLAILQLTHQEIADALGISRPTITRWISGQNAPHPALRKAVYSWLSKRAEQHRLVMERRLKVAA